MPLLDLPLELLPFIVQHIIRPHHLAQVCLVNKDFYFCAVPLLYERTAIFAWHREGKKRATQLFWTLANCPKLARYVRRLELRDFPKAISRDSTNDLMRLCVTALANCVNLVSCTWTRDGSLKDDILEALSRCPSLEALEFNGRHVRNYDPSLLNNFKKLRRLRVIMPSSEVVHALPDCFERNFGTLQELTIICKFTPVVTDSWLQSRAPLLSRLRKLHLAGCPKVTHRGITLLLNGNTVGITDLALEGVSPAFNMKDFAASSPHLLSHLTSITLTFPVAGVSLPWLNDVEALLFDALFLKQFHLYASGDQLPRPISLDTEFVKRFIERHKEKLTRFAVLRLPVSIEALDYVVKNAENLEQLFVSVWRNDLNKLGPIIAQSHTLRTVHITYAYNTLASHERTNPSTMSSEPSRSALPLNDGIHSHAHLTHEDGNEDEDDDLFLAHMESDLESLSLEHRQSVGRTQTQCPWPTMAELEDLAGQFDGNVTQFGVQTRVWQVERIFINEDDESGGRPGRRVRLAPYESPDVPDVFLVVRT